MEIWKEVDGYEGLYEVSNYGKVISLPRLKYGRRKHIKGYVFEREVAG